MTTLGIALSCVIVFAAVVCVRQFIRGLRSGDPFRPLSQGRKPHGGWGKQ
ncbi:MAG: hypothetical protein NUW01_02295 [Gemmatimonadaceae bacterium]|nr:hypothetical protein [Gemmatimonadaceae bacterium]